jgi:hypothetical protein
MSDREDQGTEPPPLRRGQCPNVKAGKRCGRPAGHPGLCDVGPPLLSLDELFGEPEP